MLKDKILGLLEERKGSIVTGGQLAGVLGVSRTAVWKVIRELKKEGNEIVALPNSGYRLMDTNDTLLEKSIREKLNTTFIGQKMELLASVASTNRYLKEMNTAALASGYVVLADEQTSGRGRKEREFVSPRRAGVYLSILLKMQVQDIRLLTICAAAAVCRAVENVCGIETQIKWVNDIYAGGKKICGILTEATLSGELLELSDVIVGIGINTASVPSEITSIATSVEELTGRRGVRNHLIAEVLNQFEQVYFECAAGGRQEHILNYYRSKLFIIGQEVMVSDAGQDYGATVLDIDETGALVVKDTCGEVHHLRTGEIALR